MSSDRNLPISSSIFLISASKRSLMLLNSVSITLKSPILMGMLRLRDILDLCQSLFLTRITQRTARHWTNLTKCENWRTRSAFALWVGRGPVLVLNSAFRGGTCATGVSTPWTVFLKCSGSSADSRRFVVLPRFSVNLARRVRRGNS